MKFVVEKKGEGYIVFNDTTGYVKGVHKTEGEAKLQASALQKSHNDGIEMASASVGPKTPPVDA